MNSDSNGIDVLTYAAAISKAKKYTDLQLNTINSEIDAKADKSAVDSQISAINSKIDAKADKSDLDGLRFKHISETEYDSLEVKDSGTVYFVS